MLSETKVCVACKKVLPRSEFYRQTHGGHMGRCKECYGKKGLTDREGRNSAHAMGKIGEDLVMLRFPDAVHMPRTHCPYDFECPKGYKIDVKTSCINKSGNWFFNIFKDDVPDYYLLVAFDDRTNLNVLRVWWVPGDVIGHLVHVSIRPGCKSEDKFEEYRNYDGTLAKCCIAMKEE
jgi:hypothetical protein